MIETSLTCGWCLDHPIEAIIGGLPGCGDEGYCLNCCAELGITVKASMTEEAMRLNSDPSKMSDYALRASINDAIEKDGGQPIEHWIGDDEYLATIRAERAEREAYEAQQTAQRIAKMKTPKAEPLAVKIATGLNTQSTPPPAAARKPGRKPTKISEMSPEAQAKERARLKEVHRKQAERRAAAKSSATSAPDSPAPQG